MSFRNFAGIIAAVLVAAQGARAQEEAELAKELGERMDQAWRASQRVPEKSRPTDAAVLEDIVASLSEKELLLAGKYLPIQGFNQAVFTRWGSIDPEAALAAARKVEDANAAEISLAGTGLEGGPGEAVSFFVHGLFLGAMKGWAKKDPKGAWSAFKKREGAFAKSEVVDDYSYQYYDEAFKNLARVDAGFAFSEMLSLRDDELRFAAMLTGYLDGAPDGQDWEKQVNALLQWKWNRGWVYREIRVALMGRWLNEDPEAAVKWFQKGDVENLHWSMEVDENWPPNKIPLHEDKKRRVRHDLGPAIGYWAARDFPRAFEWMKSHDCLNRSDFEANAMQGAERYFGGEREARGYFLQQAAKLPAQKDRGLFAVGFAKVLWDFDDTRFLGAQRPDKDAWLELVAESLAELKLDPESEREIIANLR